MSPLRKALEDYLALRRALGFKLVHTARSLPQFVRFLEREQASFITTELALRWAQEDHKASSVTHADRLVMVRRFAAWRSAEDPRTEIPPKGLLPRRYQRPTPYIYGQAEIESIVLSAASLTSRSGMRGLTCSTLFGLLAVTGMRVSEAVALDRVDVDLRAGVLAIRRGKGGKARFVPVHATTRDALDAYSRKRDVLRPGVTTPAFFLSERGGRMTAFSAGDNFVKVSRMIGLRPHAASRGRGRGPRLHDLRHRFAVSTLIHWYRSPGTDVDREVPKLTTYLGHKTPSEVYWYLQAVAELLELATGRPRVAASEGAP